MKIMLIGGRSQNPSNYIIEECMLGLVNNPRVLLFPTATRDSLKSIENLKQLFDKLNCTYDFALLFSEDRDKIINKIKEYNILYFAGGNTDVLVSRINELNLLDIISTDDKVLVGISAGMIMMSLFGMGDSYSYQDNNHTYNFKMVKGLGLLNITTCPHYDNDDLVIFNDELKKYNASAYALENDTAVVFDGAMRYVLKADKRKSVYYFSKELDFQMESLYETKTIAVLGPEGTYADLAAKQYISDNNVSLKINYYPSISKTIDAIEDNDLALLPFENSLDGYVYETIDNLVKHRCHIIDCNMQKVDFAFVSNDDLKDIKKVFVQFKAKAECIEFLTQKNDFEIVITDSNIQSLNELLKSNGGCGAVIPIHKLKDCSFKTVITNIADAENNYTKFVVVSKDEVKRYSGDLTCSLLINMKEDHPGALFNALKIFNDYKLNLNAILSRPTKEGLGKYNFYIEISTAKDKISDLFGCIDEINKNDNYNVINLGVYPKR